VVELAEFNCTVSMRVLLTVITWLVATAILVPLCFFAAIVLAGPHSSVLPSVIQPAVPLLAWVVVLAGPILIARVVWRHQKSGRIIGPP
jgi:hypothetical protein